MEWIRWKTNHTERLDRVVDDSNKYPVQLGFKTNKGDFE